MLQLEALNVARGRTGCADESDAGWSSPVARWAHNPKVAGSNPAPATNLCDFRFAIFDLILLLEGSKSKIQNRKCLSGGVAQLAEHMVCNHGVRGSNPLTSTTIDCLI